jgi:hypothetical protein
LFNKLEIKMANMWTAVIKVQTPTGGFTSHTDAAGNWGQTRATIGQITTLTVPDAGGYFTTKALLESSFGPGSVQSLIEKS